MIRSFAYIDERQLRYERSDNAKLVANYRRRKSLNKKREALRKQIAALIKEEKQVEQECQEVLEITHIVRGVALHCTEEGRRFTVSAVDWENARRGYVYLNAHNERTYGIELQACHGQYGKHANLGWNWKSYAECKKILIDWVINGTVPKGQWTWFQGA